MAPQNAAFGNASSEAASGLPDTYSASVRRCARLRSAARVRIEPRSSAASTCSALNRRSVSRRGACVSAAGPSWQMAQ
jgi:hypothetical protein